MCWKWKMAQCWQILLFIGFCLFCLLENGYSVPIQMKAPKTYQLQLYNSTYITIPMVNGLSISKIFFKHVCLNDEFQINYDDCIRYMDQMSEDYYGVHYTPSLPSSTIEDFYYDHTDLLKYLTFRYGYTKYLEIGCQNNINFNQLKELHTVAVGVDPVLGGTIRLTSDEFFQQNNQQYDLIFIDGDHTSEQVWKDIKNSLLSLTDHGTIVIHDLNPRIKDRSELLNTTVWLNNDGWKAAIAMRLVTNYEIIIVDIDHGCGVIRRKRNSHPLPDEIKKQFFHNYEPLPGKYLPATHHLQYEDFDKYRHIFFRLMTVVQMREWLEEREV